MKKRKYIIKADGGSVDINDPIKNPKDKESINHWKDVYNRNGRLPNFVWDLYTPEEQLKYFGLTKNNANQSTAFNSILKNRTAYGGIFDGNDSWVADNKQLQELSNDAKNLSRQEYLDRLSKIAYNKDNPNKKYPLEGSHPTVRPDNINAAQDAYNLFLGIPQQNNSFGISDYKPSNSKDDKYYSVS